MLRNHVLLSSRGVVTLILPDSASIHLCPPHIEVRSAALYTSTGREFYREAPISSAELTQRFRRRRAMKEDREIWKGRSGRGTFESGRLRLDSGCVAIELSGCDLDDRIIDDSEILCIRNQQSQVSQTVETARQAIGSVVKRCQGTLGEEVLSSIRLCPAGRECRQQTLPR